MIRPFMEKMTRSELHAVMTGGFATVSGSVLGTYITFGVSINIRVCVVIHMTPSLHALLKCPGPFDVSIIICVYSVSPMTPPPQALLKCPLLKCPGPFDVSISLHSVTTMTPRHYCRLCHSYLFLSAMVALI